MASNSYNWSFLANRQLRDVDDDSCLSVIEWDNNEDPDVEWMSLEFLSYTCEPIHPTLLNEQNIRLSESNIRPDVKICGLDGHIRAHSAVMTHSKLVMDKLNANIGRRQRGFQFTQIILSTQFFVEHLAKVLFLFYTGKSVAKMSDRRGLIEILQFFNVELGLIGTEFPMSYTEKTIEYNKKQTEGIRLRTGAIIVGPNNENREIESFVYLDGSFERITPYIEKDPGRMPSNKKKNKYFCPHCKMIYFDPAGSLSRHINECTGEIETPLTISINLNDDSSDVICIDDIEELSSNSIEISPNYQMRQFQPQRKASGQHCSKNNLNTGFDPNRPSTSSAATLRAPFPLNAGGLSRNQKGQSKTSQDEIEIVGSDPPGATSTPTPGRPIPTTVSRRVSNRISNSPIVEASNKWDYCKFCHLVLSYIDIGTHMDHHHPEKHDPTLTEEERYKNSVTPMKEMANTFKCSSCNQAFITQKALQSHYKKLHRIREDKHYTLYPVPHRCLVCQNPCEDEIAANAALFLDHVQKCLQLKEEQTPRKRLIRRTSRIPQKTQAQIQNEGIPNSGNESDVVIEAEVVAGPSKKSTSPSTLPGSIQKDAPLGKRKYKKKVSLLPKPVKRSKKETAATEDKNVAAVLSTKTIRVKRVTEKNQRGQPKGVNKTTGNQPIPTQEVESAIGLATGSSGRQSKNTNKEIALESRNRKLQPVNNNVVKPNAILQPVVTALNEVNSTPNNNVTSSTKRSLRKLRNREIFSSSSTGKAVPIGTVTQSRKRSRSSREKVGGQPKDDAIENKNPSKNQKKLPSEEPTSSKSVPSSSQLLSFRQSVSTTSKSVTTSKAVREFSKAVSTFSKPLSMGKKTSAVQKERPSKKMENSDRKKVVRKNALSNSKATNPSGSANRAEPLLITLNSPEVVDPPVIDELRMSKKYNESPAVAGTQLFFPQANPMFNSVSISPSNVPICSSTVVNFSHTAVVNYLDDTNDNMSDELTPNGGNGNKVDSSNSITLFDDATQHTQQDETLLNKVPAIRLQKVGNTDEYSMISATSDCDA